MEYYPSSGIRLRNGGIFTNGKINTTLMNRKVGTFQVFSSSLNDTLLNAVASELFSNQGTININTQTVKLHELCHELEFQFSNVCSV